MPSPPEGWFWRIPRSCPPNIARRLEGHFSPPPQEAHASSMIEHFWCSVATLPLQRVLLQICPIFLVWPAQKSRTKKTDMSQEWISNRSQRILMSPSSRWIFEELYQVVFKCHGEGWSKFYFGINFGHIRVIPPLSGSHLGESFAASFAAWTIVSQISASCRHAGVVTGCTPSYHSWIVNFHVYRWKRPVLLAA